MNIFLQNLTPESQQKIDSLAKNKAFMEKLVSQLDSAYILHGARYIRQPNELIFRASPIRQGYSDIEFRATDKYLKFEARVNFRTSSLDDTNSKVQKTWLDKYPHSTNSGGDTFIRIFLVENSLTLKKDIENINKIMNMEEFCLKI